MAGKVDEWKLTVYSPYPGSPKDVPATEDWAVDPHVTRGGDYQHHRDLVRCARRHGVYAPRKEAGSRLSFSG
ncbi:SUMF1/EgtB/PvdO family nonheme iron enzyme [Frankia sp. QA3]|uniref:SUMF1/EgtB/PvdO family nonheme iron enzyme n=1 Tax=Frankia sp. QA3 TaxID=710111 RepID=UPI00350EC679